MLDYQVRGPGLKTTRLLQGQLTFHSSQVNQVSTTCDQEWLCDQEAVEVYP